MGAALMNDILAAVRRTAAYASLAKAAGTPGSVRLSGLAGSALALYSSALVSETGGTHLFLCGDKDEAAYLLNDFYSILGAERVMFFPTGFKRSIRYGQEDPSGKVQRTAVVDAMTSPGKEYLVVCTYPDALLESVVDADGYRDVTVSLSVGQKLSMSSLEDSVVALGFRRVDFVSAPGEYSVRGGIMDVFSYTSNRPYRLDFFGDEISSIRSFEIATQLSVQKSDHAEIAPDMRKAAVARMVPLTALVQDAVIWATDLEGFLSKVRSQRNRLLADDPESADDSGVTDPDSIAESLSGRTVLSCPLGSDCGADAEIDFHTVPQKAYNKQFQLLAADIRDNAAAGIRTFLMTDNRAQAERLRNILDSTGVSDTAFMTVPATLHGGFTDAAVGISFCTDHQIFGRYHRYVLRGEIDRTQSLTVAELNQLRVGDYVVHVDHGVGRFGGLVSSVENGRRREAVKLIYRDGDVLLVSIHSVHRISRYRSRDTEDIPKVSKLGTGTWQRLKENTKRSVKDIARELVRLYAERKSSDGFRFSPDGYLQQQMESAFQWEETPDQQTAIEHVKEDMESAQPMDRLICGDVGFGKTEVAIRAAFKAVCDSRQVAVLVPTTILALQHYRTFCDRLSGMPVKVEMISRVRTPKDVRQICEDLAAGRIDILIGTQKMLGSAVRFKSLGLLVIDEEQKFGVSAKEKLRQMSVGVDTLTLTATPIPRTLQFSLVGARDLSVISTPPPNRQPIVTESHIFSDEVIRDFISQELQRAGQVFFVHNRIDDIETLAGHIRELVPEARVAVGHGRMSAQQMERLIMDFIYGEFDVLVSTTIVESGIDIPNANTIIISDAHRYGLSDLHQLRGRVGRSNRRGYCVLLSPPEELLTPDARRRLKAIEDFSELGSGFNIAMQDLDIRGAGNLLGAEQSGFIADMGFETYQKILNEAVSELRAEGLYDVPGISSSAAPGDVGYIDDAQIETDMDALIPEGYVSQPGERLSLYRELDGTDSEKGLQRIAAQMRDRFGELPQAVLNLFDVVRLRWRCVSLGFETAKVKNGMMILRFPADTASAYYRSAVFRKILKYIGWHQEKFVLKQNNNRPGISVRQVEGLEDAWRTLDRIIEYDDPD